MSLALLCSALLSTPVYLYPTPASSSAQLTQQHPFRGGLGANAAPREIVVTIASGIQAEVLSGWAANMERVLGGTSDTLVVVRDKVAVDRCRQLSLPCFAWPRNVQEQRGTNILIRV